ncbi:T9SS type A sorting domain-containing protein, partial [Winogradskyella alexanderae]
GFDVNGLLVQGGGDLCASLDVPGAPIHVEEECSAYAGRMKSYHPLECLYGGVATINATQVVDPVIPDGFQQLFVLTNAFTLTILDVNTVPEFDVNHVGFYRIHSLVYNPDTLDLSIVQFGETTAFDVLPLLQQGGGNICASLDVRGAISVVLPKFFCQIFGGFSLGKDFNSDEDIVNNWINEYDNYKDFETAMLKEVTKTTVYPNPARQNINVNTIVLEDEVISYSIADMQGRVLNVGEISNLEKGNYQLNVSNLSNGTYIVQFNSEFRNISTKIQVQR